MLIKKIDFSKSGIEKLNIEKFGTNWPVVYLINDDSKIYIGETLDAKRRLDQHLKDTRKEGLRFAHVITDKSYNKSVILDLESFLIKYISADNKYAILNSNNGIIDHKYFNKRNYAKTFERVWNILKKNELVDKTLLEISNSELFKYSPYKALTEEQKHAADKINEIITISASKNEKSTIVVEGGAGTGKTVLAVYLVKLIKDIHQIFDEEFSKLNSFIEDDLSFDDDQQLETSELIKTIKENKKFKIGFYVPMQSLRETIKKVFENTIGLDADMVIHREDLEKNKYDLILVDEAHRLQQYGSMAQYSQFYSMNDKFGYGRQEGTELDWIIESSQIQVLFYDSLQSVRPADISKDKFNKLVYASKNPYKINLNSQLRVLGGNDYIKYIHDILNLNNPDFINFDDYEFSIFEDVNEMVNEIKEKDKEFGLSRTVAGYSWKWVTKGSKRKISRGERDIVIGKYGYVWNTESKDWVSSKNAVNEIGSIHTIQGYDLNYAGVIFGYEIDYDPINNKIIVDKKSYFDNHGRNVKNDEEALKNYIINIYTTMLTRGIRGTFVYACNENLRDYLRKFITYRK